MRLTSLRLKNFRNHNDSYFQFGNTTNVLIGDNGQGKTNVLEAISYLCLTKSFFTTNDSVALRLNELFFEIEGSFESESNSDSKVRVAYDKQTAEKAFFINKKNIEPLASVVGRFPVVMCSPEHHPITHGGPDDRRRFVDFVMSQANIVYFKTLLEYRKVLKQRNKILFDAKLSNRQPVQLLEPWDEQFILLGAQIIVCRMMFVEEFKDILRTAYHHLMGTEEEPMIEYVPLSENFSNEVECATILKRMLAERRADEFRTASTLVGPHRDEFVFTLNGLDLRKYGSQGEHKTFLVAIKLGEFRYLQQLREETPLLLLDDVFSELDEHRAKRLLDLVGTMSQTFITSTSVNWFNPFIEFGADNKKFTIRNGSVIENEIMVSA